MLVPDKKQESGTGKRHIFLWPQCKKLLASNEECFVILFYNHKIPRCTKLAFHHFLLLLLLGNRLFFQSRSVSHLSSRVEIDKTYRTSSRSQKSSVNTNEMGFTRDQSKDIHINKEIEYATNRK